MKILIVLLLISLSLTPAFAQTNSQTLPTEKGTLDVKLSYDDISPGQETRLVIDFINPQTNNVQEHIDYTIQVSNQEETIFGPIPLTHTSVGSVRIPVEFPSEGIYTAALGVEGILFQPIPEEKVTFEILVGEASAQTPEQPSSPLPEENGNGGCLIATAAFGSELAPQVQQLRELRDNTVLTTASGTAFMAGFNQFYYSFSPAVADFEREQPIFREFMQLALTPMLTSLLILNHVNIDSEAEMLGYGIPIVLLNLGMYVGIPVFGVLKLYQSQRK